MPLLRSWGIYPIAWLQIDRPSGAMPPTGSRFIQWQWGRAAGSQHVRSRRPAVVLQRARLWARLSTMSLEQVESAILALNQGERRQLAAWFEAHRPELLDDGAGTELTPEQQAEILRRREQALTHPDLLEPWDGTIDPVRHRLHELRRQKAASR
jgi:hypothetical protein